MVTGCRAGAGTRPGPGCSRQPYSLAEREMGAAGPSACHRFPFPARSVTGWPDQVVSAAPAMAGRGMHNQQVKMAQGTVKWFNGGKGLWLHRGRGGPGRVRTFQRGHRRRLPQPGRRAEVRVRHHPGPEGTSGRKRQDHRLTHGRERRRRRRRSPRRTAVTQRRAADRVERGELPGHRLGREISSGLAMVLVQGFASRHDLED